MRVETCPPFDLDDALVGSFYQNVLRLNAFTTVRGTYEIGRRAADEVWPHLRG